MAGPSKTLSPIKTRVPLLRPTGKFLTMTHQRYLIGREIMILQGIPVHRLDTSMCSEAASQLQLKAWVGTPAQGGLGAHGLVRYCILLVGTLCICAALWQPFVPPYGRQTQWSSKRLWTVKCLGKFGPIFGNWCKCKWTAIFMGFAWRLILD